MGTHSVHVTIKIRMLHTVLLPQKTIQDKIPEETCCD